MRPSAAHLKLLKFAAEGDSMQTAIHRMLRTEANVEKLFYELIDGNMIEHCARDEPMTLTRLGRAVLKGGAGTFKLKRPPIRGRPV